ncbi:hypothetical protein AGMMS50267_07100 [Spirochaetia bacterium]|nr:hypothetical protein AGMMS50267_07100 [Spirochaetia bacterium]
MYLGGEKLNRTPVRLTAVLYTAAIFFINIAFLSAQDAPDLGSVTGTSGGSVSTEADVPDTAESGASASAESFFVFSDAPSGEAIAPSGGASVFVVLRMVLVLALTAAAVYGVVFFLRRAGRPRDQHNPHLKILTSAHLGSNRYVYVVSVGTKAWLIGAGEGGVTPISEISDQEAVDAMLLDDSRRSAEAAPSRFSDFRALLGRIGGGSPGTGPVSALGLRSRRERLKGL